MVIVYMVASLFGAAITAALCGANGVLTALLAAPFGGSLSAVIAAWALAPQRPVQGASRPIPAGVVWC